MNKDKEVKIGDRVLHPKGSLLTLSAQEASEKINGTPVLADGIAESIPDLMQKAGLRGQAVDFPPSGFEQLAFWLTQLAPLLLLGGIIGAYLEFKIPGFGVAGIVSIICFALFFLGHYFAGLAGWEAVALFVLGILFVLVEILFFGHATILFGVVGVLLMLAALLWAMIDRYPGQEFFPTGQMLKIPLLNLFLTFVGAAILIMVLTRFLPRTSVYRRFILSTTNPPGPSLAAAPRPFVTALPLAPGMQGRALTILRPSGKAEFDNHIVDVVTEGEFISPQSTVAIVSTDGMRVVVKGIGT
jgi:membrane-bound serine protease (ClpP class)